MASQLSAVDMIKILTCFLIPPLAVYFDRYLKIYKNITHIKIINDCLLIFNIYLFIISIISIKRI